MSVAKNKIVGKKKKATKTKEEVNFLSLKRVKFVKMIIFYSL